MEEIYVTRSTMPDRNEYYKEIEDLWESHWLTNMGKKHQELEKRLKRYCGVDNISLFVNGHMALEMCIQAMNLSGEVITTPFTFVSTTHAIVRNGLTPKFCDIKDTDFTIDENKIESLIDEKTCAIIPVHVYGNICNIERIEFIAKKYGLKVIYDAAHAFGETYRGIGIGNFGDAAMFSFHATKVFNSIEGGAICYKNSEIGDSLYQLKNFGIYSETEINGIGANAKMNEFQAAMGLCNLRNIGVAIGERKSIFERYKERLLEIEGIRLGTVNTLVESNYAYMPIIVEEEKYGINRDALFSILHENCIYARKYFYPLTNTLSCYQGKVNLQEQSTPIAKKISNSVITLPIYSELSLEDVDRICNVIEGAKRKMN